MPMDWHVEVPAVSPTENVMAIAPVPEAKRYKWTGDLTLKESKYL